VTPHLAAHGEPPRHAFEVGQRARVLVEWDREEVADREHAKRVEHVVRARHREHNLAQLVGAAPGHEPRGHAVVTDVARAVDRLRGDAERREPLGQRRQDRLHARVVET
jgi:hypothetical protein